MDNLWHDLLLATFLYDCNSPFCTHWDPIGCNPTLWDPSNILPISNCRFWVNPWTDCDSTGWDPAIFVPENVFYDKTCFQTFYV